MITTSPPSEPTETELVAGAAPQSRLLLLLFLYLVYVILCGIGNITYLNSTQVGFFVAWAALVLTALAAALPFFSRVRHAIPILGLAACLVLAILPAMAFRASPIEEVLLLDLYFILLVASPALLRLWSWRLQLVVGVATTFCVYILTFPASSWFAFHSIVLVAVATLLATAVSFVRRYEERALIDAEQQALALVAEFNRTQMPLRVWNVNLLQSGLLAILIFLDIAFWGQMSSPQFFAKVYALIIVIFSSLLLGILNARYLESALTISTILVAAALSVSAVYTVDLNVIHGALPLAFLCFTTVRLSWKLERQIAVSWAVILSAIMAKIIISGVPTGSLIGALGLLISRHQAELAVLLAGAAFSVIANYLMSQRSLTSLSHIVENIQLGAAEGKTSELDHQLLFASSARWVSSARLSQLVDGLFVLGLCSNFFSTVLLLRVDSPNWYYSAGGWLVFLSLWGALRYFWRNDTLHEQLWFLGAFTALLLVLWPSILLLKSGAIDEFWIVWPAVVFLGIGSIPWGLVEIIPLVMVALFAGLEVLKQSHLGSPGVVLFTVTMVLSLLFSAAGNRRLRERYLLAGFHGALNASANEKDAFRILADCLMCLFGVGSSLLSLNREHMELVRQARVFPLNPNIFPLMKLREQLTDFRIEPDGVGMRFIAWLPVVWRFFDKRFGVFSAPHGLMFELASGNGSLHSAPTEISNGASGGPGKVEKPDKTLLFMAFDLPLVTLFKTKELRLARILAATTNLRLQSFRERQLRLNSTQTLQAEQAEREYELSTLVHDINNTVQDLTLLCDTILEDASKSESQPFMWDDGENTPKLVPQIRRIAVTARSMATVVSDAKRKRELERLQDLRPRELVEVCEVLEEIVSFAKVRAERKRIEVEYADVPEELLWVRISAREHLETILRNLMNNAVMYSDPGKKVEVRLKANPESISIEVADNGPGLSSEECKTIFLSGYRGKSASRIVGGLGLGLAQSRRVAEWAGGTLDVYSAGLGKGSTFTVTLPRHASPTQSGLHPFWALMVDDQPATAEFYARIAKALQLSPAVASSVSEAISIIEEKGRPAFVLTDLHLGSSDGLELVRYLRQEFDGNLPILVVSGINDDDIEERARRAGATDFVSKPVGRQSLFSRIQSLLQRDGVS